MSMEMQIASQAPAKAGSLSDYAQELARIDRELAESGPDVETASLSHERLMTFVQRLFARSSLTGRWADSERASRAIAQALPKLADRSDMHYLQVQLSLRYHKLDDARRQLAQSRTLLESIYGQELQAEIDFYSGQYQLAEQRYRAIIERDRTWDALARLAYMRWKMGARAEADALYLEAEDELTAKQMRTYAWLELQRGALALQHGDYTLAGTCYQRADRSYTGYWQVEDHIAELTAAAGNYARAAQIWERVAAQTEKPEFQQVLGDLYDVAGDRMRSRACYLHARDAYLASAQAGHTHYYHHLVDLYLDGLPNADEAVRWARADLALRDNFATQIALAHALHAARRSTEAQLQLDRALAAGFRDAHTLRFAARVYEANGHLSAARQLAEQAAQLNPSPGAFHVHR